MSLEPDYKLKWIGKGQITNDYANYKHVTYFTYCILHHHCMIYILLMFALYHIKLKSKKYYPS